MDLTAFRYMKPFPKLMFSAFVILVCFLFFLVLSIVAAIPFFGIEFIVNIPSVNDLGDPESIRILKYLKIILRSI